MIVRRKMAIGLRRLYIIEKKIKKNKENQIEYKKYLFMNYKWPFVESEYESHI